MNEWWRWHRSHTLACFVSNFVCHLTYLPIPPQGRPRFEFSYRVTYSNQSNSTLYVQKNDYVPNSPVELAKGAPTTISGQCFTLTSHPWWRHQMEKFSALMAICAGNSPVPGEFPTQRPVTQSFGVFFDLRLNKRLSKQSWGWWLNTLSRPLWRHRKDRRWLRWTCWLLLNSSIDLWSYHYLCV